MVLSNTVDKMLSEDYKERFIAEYQQLSIRHDGLKKMLDNWDKGNLNFIPTCPRSTYDLQIKAMNDYRAVLEARAVMENIDLQKIIRRKRGIIMSNSKLVNYTKLSPNHSGKRTHSIDRITPHCVVGQCSVETLGNIFMNTAREASCNYGIGYDGRVLLCVDEGNRSWCSSSNANDQRAVTIECASDTTAPYTMNSKVYNKLVALCVDICKRNGKTKLLWFGNEDKTLNYSPRSGEMVLTVHRWFANKSCPGDWLYNRLGNLADEVTAQLGGKTSNKENEEMIKYGAHNTATLAFKKQLITLYNMKNYQD